MLDSNGASGGSGKDQKQPEVTKAESTKMDIFSQAMASAEIGDFAATNSSKCYLFTGKKKSVPIFGTGFQAGYARI